MKSILYMIFLLGIIWAVAYATKQPTVIIQKSQTDKFIVYKKTKEVEI